MAPAAIAMPQGSKGCAKLTMLASSTRHCPVKE
jgi:hypothetical protein